MASTRTFEVLGFELDEPGATLVRTIQDELRNAGYSVDNESPHLTVSGIEHCNRHQVIAELPLPTSFLLDSYGLVNRTSSFNVVWLNVVPTSSLLKFQKTVADVLEKNGEGEFDPLNRVGDWVPHVTLCRGFGPDGLEVLRRFPFRAKEVGGGDWFFSQVER